MLQIDSQTAMEARGRYVRLCIQLDITKPLINTVLIGRFEQSVVYEGIHRLCFSCGRIGHRKEACPLTIKKPEKPAEAGPIGGGVEKNTNQGADQRGTHDSYESGTSSGTSNDRGVDAEEDRYGPWMIVARRKPGQKKKKIQQLLLGTTLTGDWAKSIMGLGKARKEIIGIGQVLTREVRLVGL